MARKRSSVTFEHRQIDVRVRELTPTIHARVGLVAAYTASEAVAFAKANARWMDQTGAARSGLFAIPSRNGNTYSIILSHGTSYGIWLEVKHSGRYAIIEQSLRAAGANLMSRLERVVLK